MESLIRYVHTCKSQTQLSSLKLSMLVRYATTVQKLKNPKYDKLIVEISRARNVR